MIADLLDLTAIESGQRQRTFTTIDLAEIARQGIENVKAEAQSRHIVIDLDIPKQTQMEADRAEMEIIFNNLISNAVKYNRDGGRVEVSVHGSGDEVRIQVTDTGIGMNPEETKRLFTDFGRIKNEKTRHILGSGLGLSTVKKIVNLYHGDITVQSQPDIGSTFTAILRPIAKVVQ